MVVKYLTRTFSVWLGITFTSCGSQLRKIIQYFEKIFQHIQNMINLMSIEVVTLSWGCRKWRASWGGFRWSRWWWGSRSGASLWRSCRAPCPVCTARSWVSPPCGCPSWTTPHTRRTDWCCCLATRRNNPPVWTPWPSPGSRNSVSQPCSPSCAFWGVDLPM